MGWDKKGLTHMFIGVALGVFGSGAATYTAGGLKDRSIPQEDRDRAEVQLISNTLNEVGSGKAGKYTSGDIKTYIDQDVSQDRKNNGMAGMLAGIASMGVILRQTLKKKPPGPG